MESNGAAPPAYTDAAPISANGHALQNASNGEPPEVLASAAPGKPSVHFFYSAEIVAAPPVVVAPDAAAAATAAATPAPAGASSLTPLQYLEKHNIAPLLNTAVNELGKAQPADPVPWLAKWLADKGKQ